MGEGGAGMVGFEPTNGGFGDRCLWPLGDTPTVTDYVRNP
jgi:hypothetical protein